MCHDQDLGRADDYASKMGSLMPMEEDAELDQALAMVDERMYV